MYVCMYLFMGFSFQIALLTIYSFHQIQCLDVLLEDMDVVKGITEYVSYAAIENLVLGQASRHGFIR